jgi:hypothetical protein
MFVDLYITNTTAGHPLMAKKNMENKTGHANGHAHVLKLTAMVRTQATEYRRINSYERWSVRTQTTEYGI